MCPANFSTLHLALVTNSSQLVTPFLYVSGS